MFALHKFTSVFLVRAETQPPAARRRGSVHSTVKKACVVRLIAALNRSQQEAEITSPMLGRTAHRAVPPCNNDEVWESWLLKPEDLLAFSITGGAVQV
jgi:hypothetical protein